MQPSFDHDVAAAPLCSYTAAISGANNWQFKGALVGEGNILKESVRMANDRQPVKRTLFRKPEHTKTQYAANRDDHSTYTEKACGDRTRESVTERVSGKRHRSHAPSPGSHVSQRPTHREVRP